MISNPWPVLKGSKPRFHVPSTHTPLFPLSKISEHGIATTDRRPLRHKARRETCLDVNMLELKMHQIKEMNAKAILRKKIANGLRYQEASKPQFTLMVELYLGSKRLQNSISTLTSVVGSAAAAYPTQLFTICIAPQSWRREMFDGLALLSVDAAGHDTFRKSWLLCETRIVLMRHTKSFSLEEGRCRFDAQCSQ